MDSAEFLQSAHGLIARLIETKGIGSLGGVALFCEEGEALCVELPDDPEERPAFGLFLAANPAVSVGIIGLDAQSVPGEPYDVLVLGCYYERDAPEMLRLRAFCMEWQAPARLGWFEPPPLELGRDQLAALKSAYASSALWWREHITRPESYSVRGGNGMRLWRIWRRITAN